MAPGSAAPPGGGADLCVLGPVSVNVGGEPVPIGGRKPRQVTAMLIVHRNTVVSADRLARVLWGDDVPPSGAGTLQAYVSRLRRVLPPSARLVSEAPGYRLCVEHGATDVDRFETALAAGVDALGRSPVAALAHLDAALAQWRGAALAEFDDEWWAHGEATRLEELRMQAHDARLAALLALGHDEQAAGDASVLVADHPWRERPWRVLVSALHRMGRQAEALRRAKDYRTRLREDLGLDPTSEFAALEREVLTGTPSRGGSLIAAEPAEAQPEDPQGTEPAEAQPEDPQGAEPTEAQPEDPQGAEPTEARPEDPQGAEPVARGRPPVSIPASDVGELGGVHLIGRDEDLANVVDMSTTHRLVTLLGPGGIGKTQLALRAADEIARRGQLGTDVVELAPVREVQGVVAALATQLHVQPQQGRSVTESVLDVLGQRRLLLVIDNCEHVLETIASFVERLLRVCPGVHVLATSREPLALPAERVYKVPSLRVADDGVDVGRALESPAVDLFLERARAANPDFRVDDASAAAVVELCRRLDGIPLAIELAAARTRSLSPTEIATRLGDRFALLARASRVSGDRHRSLRDLVDWSYQLLDPLERQLFRRLSVFAGSFDLEAVERVCADGELPSHAVASVVAGLVDKSMVQASTTGTRTTYRMLETLREYASALLGDERPQLASRHTAWVLGICRRAERELHGVDERSWHELLDARFDDLRLAARHALDAGDVTSALGIVVGAREHSFRRLRYELIGWAENAVGTDDACADPLGAAALGIVAYGRFVRGEFDAAVELGESARALARERGTDTLGVAERALGNTYVFRGDVARSADVLDRLVEGAVAAADDARVAHALYMRSLSDTRTAGATSGLAYAEEAVQAAHRCGNPTAMAQAAYALGIWRSTTDPHRARELLHNSEALAAAAGNTWLELFAQTETLWLQALDGEPRMALAGFADVISAWHRAGDWANQWLSLRHVFGICHLLGANELAVMIHSALERAGAVDAFPFEPAAAARLATMIGELRQRLGDERFETAAREGRHDSTSLVIDRIVSQLRELC